MSSVSCRPAFAKEQKKTDPPARPPPMAALPPSRQKILRTILRTYLAEGQCVFPRRLRTFLTRLVAQPITVGAHMLCPSDSVEGRGERGGN
ncbi:hypothetical protein, unlikely [Anopheles sinensis]|uniref:Uncharacterized protein n=1 Tax=Anopheles sinensis TaxID=74873 RepID=A0A084VBX2_ANOSI|nr:hypothetical protein, unlikely [Anopheles sinensis]